LNLAFIWRVAQVLIALALILIGSSVVASTSRAGDFTSTELASVIRIDVGGRGGFGPPSWLVDRKSRPSRYTNARAAKSGVEVTTSSLRSDDRSVPPGTPRSIFRSQRIDPRAGEPMRWTIPVEPGTYDLRLYFMEMGAAREYLTFSLREGLLSIAWTYLPRSVDSGPWPRRYLSTPIGLSIFDSDRR
jgi:hypothetical protein